MKKILLAILIIILALSINVVAVDITMGNPAIEGAGPFQNPATTQVDKYTPANGTGTITTFEIWANAPSDTTTLTIATFSADGNVLTARDHEIVGPVVEGYNSFEVTLNVVEGDYIGMYIAGTWGVPEYISENDTGLWLADGDQTQGTDVTFTAYNNYYFCMKGTGTTEEEEEEDNAIFMGCNF